MKRLVGYSLALLGRGHVNRVAFNNKIIYDEPRRMHEATDGAACANSRSVVNSIRCVDARWVTRAGPRNAHCLPFALLLPVFFMPGSHVGMMFWGEPDGNLLLTLICE
jgi:hypothetical protein